MPSDKYVFLFDQSQNTKVLEEYRGNDGFNSMLRWDDARINALSMRVGSHSEPEFKQAVNNGEGSVGAYAWHFAPTHMQNLFFHTQLPHTYSPDTELRPHVHFSPTTTGTGTIRWGLEYAIASVNDPFPNTQIIWAEHTVQAGDEMKHLVLSLPVIDGLGITESAMIVGRVIRMGPDDTYTEESILWELDFHFQVEKDGTAFEFGEEEIW